MNRKVLVFFSIILFTFIYSGNLSAAETRDGHIRLLINEKKGGFSLFYLTDSREMHYEPLFNHNPSTSFIDVNVNGTSYRPGKSRAFKKSVDRQEKNPNIIFESDFLHIKQFFTPVKTSSSSFANGVKLNIIITNTSAEELQTGLRFLLDTSLGEGARQIPFITGKKEITSETIIECPSDELYWISQGKNASLMGNIACPDNSLEKSPNYLHFANWNILSEVPWKANLREGRSLSRLPYSVRDSAVCYYWEPSALQPGESFIYAVYLTTEDIDWHLPQQEITENAPMEEKADETEERAPEAVRFASGIEASTIDIEAVENEAVIEAAETEENVNIVTLRFLQEILDQFIFGEIMLNEQDLKLIEMSFARHSVLD